MAYDKSELDKSSPKEVPSFLTEVGTRLRVVEKLYKNRAAAAAAAGVVKSTFQNWIDGARDPSFRSMATLAKATGISLNWLATGEGPMYTADTAATTVADPAPAPPQTIEGYPPFVPILVKSKIIGTLLGMESAGEDLPLKVIADRAVELYMEDYYTYFNGEREIPTVEASAEVFESLRPRRHTTTKAG